MLRAALFTIVLGASTSAIAAGMPDSPPPPPVPGARDGAAIATAMATAKPRITKCGDAETANGMVKLDVVVGADGRVTSAKTDRPAGDRLDTCIAGVMKSITFAKTLKGGSFSYPLVFGSRVPDEPIKQPVPTAPDDTFDRAAIQAGIALVKPKITACGSKTKANGTVKMRVVVGADGKVTSASAEASPDPKLGECVTAVFKAAKFKKTPSGGSFSYPFVFGSPNPAPPPATTGPLSSPPMNPSETGSGLDRSMIQAGIAKVKAKISACGTANPDAKGAVKIKVDVAPAGTVRAAAVTSAPTEPLGACVAGVIKGATFVRTSQGGTFSYPFVF